MIRLWRTSWNEFIPFLDYDVETRKVICSTNALVGGLNGVVSAVVITRVAALGAVGGPHTESVYAGGFTGPDLARSAHH